ncbi:polysaccharide biosynthesis tyrosine autokinase [Paraburkholderia hospita]|uniref:polysaccharide biosynthesis tyrosine autokinase n=1 Tax=Paraburkholderia hospita TaxID=169430 RepID=UPI000B34937C|nr:polysaccharide biosynthesis tyrosine autokinase [Paraburkholderia hospita]OUL94258.1 protein tyrosine kinase [Paraburkholderia hospita]
MNTAYDVDSSLYLTGGRSQLADYLSMLAGSWRTVVAATVIALFCGIVYALVATPEYQASALIRIEDNRDSSSKALGDGSPNADAAGITAAEMEMIRSRLVLGRAVDELHLDVDARPRYVPLIGSALARIAGDGEMQAPRLGLRHFAWGGEKLKVGRFDVPAHVIGKGFVLQAGDAGDYDLLTRTGQFILHGKIGRTVTVQRPDGPVTIAVDQLVANPSTQFFVTRQPREQTIDALQNALQIAEKGKESRVIGVSLTGDDRVQTAMIVNAIAQQYVKQNVLSKSGQAEASLSFLEQQLPALRAELESAEERYNRFRNENRTVDLSEESRLTLQQIVDNTSKMLDLKRQHDQLALRFTGASKEMTALDADITTTQRQLDQLNQRVLTLPDTQQTELRLLRDVHVDTELYTNLLNSAQQLRIVRAGEIGNARVVDYAVPPEYPTRPKRKTIVGFSLLLGLLTGVVAALSKKFLFSGIEDAREMERSIGVPVCAVVPRSRNQLKLCDAMKRGRGGRNYVLAAKATNDIAIEGIRGLRTALQFGLLDPHSKIIMVAGPSSGVGKSFLSVNLSAVLASTGKRVILVDADMRLGNIHEYLGIQPRPGLPDVIAGRDLVNVVVKNALPGVDVLPRGDVPSNPSELLMNDGFRDALVGLSAVYDFVIVDTPPILAVTDAAIIGRYADVALLVVRHGKHSSLEVGEAVKRLTTAGIALRGVVMTDMPGESQRRERYYSA